MFFEQVLRDINFSRRFVKGNHQIKPKAIVPLPRKSNKILFMKKALTFIPLFLFLMSSPYAFTQITVGPKVGFNLADMLIKDKEIVYSIQNKYKVGFHIGGTATYEVFENFSVEAGLLFTNKGYHQDSGSSKIKMYINYIELPINAVYKIELKNYKLNVFAGPYISYAVGGKIRSNTMIFMNAEGEKVNELQLKFGSDLTKHQFRKMDFGLNFGAGVELTNKVSIDLHYELGMYNISVNTKDKLSYRNQVIEISLGYKFDLKI
jgi:opacity protein-like surface antigen